MSTIVTLSPRSSALENVEVVESFSGADELLQRAPDCAPWILVEDAHQGLLARAHHDDGQLRMLVQ